MNARHLLAATLMACTPHTGSGPDDATLTAARKATPAGARVFALRCAHCHGEHGDAPMAPRVMGRGALARRPGLENGLDLFRYLSARMPPGGAARELTPAEHWAVTEYLLRARGLAVPRPLDATTAARVRLE